MVGLTVVLLAVVAFASRGFEVAGGTPRSGALKVPRMPAAAAEYLLLLTVVGVAGLAVLLAFALGGIARRRKKDDEELVPPSPRASWWSGLFAVLVVVGAVALPIALLVWTGGRREHAALPSVVVGSPRVGVPSAPQTPVGGGTPSQAWDWTPVIVMAVCALAVGVVAGLRRRRRRAAPSGPRRRTELAKSIEWTIDDIRRDPDPRHAVISAYARMERELSEGGWPRRPSRAPLEYLEEALAKLAVPASPARSLTGLFEIAKFSRRPVDDTMKDRAIDALVDVRRALETEPS